MSRILEWVSLLCAACILIAAGVSLMLLLVMLKEVLI